jgi:hypothetical protein
LRIPKAIIDQNAGNQCTDKEAAYFVSVGYNGPFRLEISSALKYGLLTRPEPNKIIPTERAKRILKPQNDEDELNGIRESILKAPVISEVYAHYRGENLPDTKYFQNALTETFKIPKDKIDEFNEIFMECLKSAKLIEQINEKWRVTDISDEKGTQFDVSSQLKKLEKEVKINATDSCFVMMPFALPLGEYYIKIFEPAIIKSGLKPMRADDEIFGTGKIIDQIWKGINSSKVLIAELTSRNPNVFYELGIAHALKKPVVLISENEKDVPFDLQHVRVIYYDKNDPFWGQKLIDKIAENILSAVKNPNEAILFRE